MLWTEHCLHEVGVLLSSVSASGILALAPQFVFISPCTVGTQMNEENTKKILEECCKERHSKRETDNLHSRDLVHSLFRTGNRCCGGRFRKDCALPMPILQHPWLPELHHRVCHSECCHQNRHQPRMLQELRQKNNSLSVFDSQLIGLREWRKQRKDRCE